MTVRLRAYRPADLDALSAIADANAADRHDDPRLMGHVYGAPYAAFSPETVSVAEDAEGVGGTIVGALDTRAFEMRLDDEWWPPLRRAHAAPAGDPAAWTPDQRRHHGFHNPRRTPDAVAGPYPSHVHLQLLPRLRGRGIGSALLARWAEAARRAGYDALHVGVNRGNPGAVAFWQKRGFRELDVAEAAAGRTAWFGRR